MAENREELKMETVQITEINSENNYYHLSEVIFMIFFFLGELISGCTSIDTFLTAKFKGWSLDINSFNFYSCWARADFISLMDLSLLSGTGSESMCSSSFQIQL